MSVEFTNVQFSGKEAGMREQLLAAIDEIYEEDETWELVDRAGDADVTVAVGPRHGAGWVGVYFRDPAPGAFAGTFARDVSARLSDGTDSAAVGFHGSGRRVRLYFVRNGGAIGEYDSARPDAAGAEAVEFGEELREEGASPEALEAVWSNPPEHADEAVDRFAELWAMEPSLVSAGYHYIELNVAGEVEQRHFRRRSSETLLERVQGPASFEAAGRVRELETSVGEEFRAPASFGNRGGAATGIRVVVRGPALEDSLVEVDAIRIDGGVTGDFIEREVERRSSDTGESIAVATFPEWAVEGALSEDVDFSDLSEEQNRDVMAAHRASRISVYALGRAATPGEGEIRISVGAIESGRERAAEERSKLVVYPKSRLPLPAEPESAPPHTLRQLEKEETLFALIHFDRPVGAWASTAAEAIGRWTRAIADSEDVFVQVEVGDLRSRPSESLVSAETFADSEEVAELVGQIGALHQFSALLRPPGSGVEQFDPDVTGGFSYFALSGSGAGSGGEAAPALGFWVGIAERSEREIEQFRTLLREIVDAFARSGRLVQAIVDAWAWAPSTRIRSVPFEIVSGLSSSGHLRVDWLRRYLRAASPSTWVGPELWEHLDADAIDDVAEVETLGPVHRIDLRENVELDAYERALEPVLPDADAWRREAR